MIRVTRLDGSSMIVNVDLIQWIEPNVDTMLVLSNGERLIVRERPEELVRRVREFKRSIVEGPVVLRGAFEPAEGTDD